MQNFSELKELLRVVNIETDNINIQIQKILDEAFIEDCTEYGLRKYESQLGIKAVLGEKLEFRKNRVKAYWLMNMQYNYKLFVQSLNMLLGGNWNYDMVCDQENYKMTLNVYKKEHLVMLEDFLQRVLPMNIDYELHLTKDWATDSYFGIVWQDDEIFKLRQVVM